ncbi:hypothetical protein BGZ94_004659, partial [Podila epigama]
LAAHEATRSPSSTSNSTTPFGANGESAAVTATDGFAAVREKGLPVTEALPVRSDRTFTQEPPIPSPSSSSTTTTPTPGPSSGKDTPAQAPVQAPVQVSAQASAQALEQAPKQAPKQAPEQLSALLMMHHREHTPPSQDYTLESSSASRSPADDSQTRPESVVSTPLSSWSSSASSPTKALDDDLNDALADPDDDDSIRVIPPRSNSTTPVPTTSRPTRSDTTGTTKDQPPLNAKAGSPLTDIVVVAPDTEGDEIGSSSLVTVPNRRRANNKNDHIKQGSTALAAVLIDDDNDEDNDDDDIEIIDITAPTRRTRYPPLDNFPRVQGGSIGRDLGLPSLSRLASSMESDPNRRSMSVQLILQDDDDDITGGYEDRYGRPRDTIRIDSEVQEPQFDRFHPWAQGPVQFILPRDQWAIQGAANQERRLEQQDLASARRQIQEAFDLDEDLPHIDYEDEEEQDRRAREDEDSMHDSQEAVGPSDDDFDNRNNNNNHNDDDDVEEDEDDGVSQQQIERDTQYLLDLRRTGRPGPGSGRTEGRTEEGRTESDVQNTLPHRHRRRRDSGEDTPQDEIMLSPEQRPQRIRRQLGSRTPSIIDTRMLSPDQGSQNGQASDDHISRRQTSTPLSPHRSRASSTSVRPEYAAIFALNEPANLTARRRANMLRESPFPQGYTRDSNSRQSSVQRFVRQSSTMVGDGMDLTAARRGVSERNAIEIPDSPPHFSSAAGRPSSSRRRSTVERFSVTRNQEVRSSATPAPSRERIEVTQRTVIDLEDSPSPGPSPRPSLARSPRPSSRPSPSVAARNSFLIQNGSGARGESLVQRVRSKSPLETRFSPMRHGSVDGPTPKAKPKWASEKLVCSVCMDSVVDAMVTPCGHLYCNGCIETSLAYDGRCPQCRTPLARGKLQALALLHAT